MLNFGKTTELTARFENGINVLVIYTGGTLGMVRQDDSLVPVKFEEIESYLPELKTVKANLRILSAEKPVDSSNVNTEFWIDLVEAIQENWSKTDAFVVIHGTDTMAYTASMLSFMIQNPNKPIILTGSQLPVGINRTDARENLMSSIEICIARYDSLQEICIYFNGKLFRGNRCRKVESSQFDAFESENYPLLAEIGAQMDFFEQNFLKRNNTKETLFTYHLDTKIRTLKLYPGIDKDFIRNIFEDKNVKGILLETYGAGNAPEESWFTDLLILAQKEKKLILNITQCIGGKVQMNTYKTGETLAKYGVVSGYDIVFEAAVCKLMWVLGTSSVFEERRTLFNTNLAGEISIF
jgi:L-asparaginase